MNLTIGSNVWDELPKNSNGEEDWSLSSDGGNYAFGHRDVLVNGKKVGQLKTTSSGISFCEVTGTFTKTEVVCIRETGHKVCVDRDFLEDEYQSYISAQEFLSMLNW